MSKLTKIEGLISSSDVIFTDETCRTIDEDACREVWKYLLECGVSAIVTNEEPQCLTLKERSRLLEIAVDEVKGRVPVLDYIWSDTTRGAIEQGLNAKEHGAAAVLSGPPNIMGWDGTTTEYLVEHFRKFSKEADIPLILMGGPGLPGNFYMPPQTFVEVAKQVDNLLGCKFTVADTASFVEPMRALKAVRENIVCLKAGSLALADAYLAGGDGSLSGLLALAKEDVQIFKACRNGDSKTAKEISAKVLELGLAIYGFSYNWPLIYFEYRFKIASWLMGLIPRPYMRRPYLPPPLKEIETIRDLLIKTGKPVVNEPKQLAISTI